MRTDSMRPALPYAAEAVALFAHAIRMIDSADLDGAQAVLASLDDGALRAHFDDAIAEWGKRNSVADYKYTGGKIPKAERALQRMPSKAAVLAIYERDGWRCRWCSTPVIYLDAAKAVARRLLNNRLWRRS